MQSRFRITCALAVVATVYGCAAPDPRHSAPIHDRSSGTAAISRSATVPLPAPIARRTPIEAATATPLQDRVSVEATQSPPPVIRDPATQSLLVAAMQAATQGEWERAQATLERAVKLSPTDNGLWRQLAYTHYRRGDSEQALVIAERSLALSDSRAERVESWNLIADIETARGNHEAARKARAEAGPRLR
jgi:Flp pilus assembly protein TadD